LQHERQTAPKYLLLKATIGGQSVPMHDDYVEALRARMSDHFAVPLGVVLWQT
jgi:hypothetical protein